MTNIKMKELLTADLVLKVWDKDGKLIEERHQPSRSPVRALLEQILAMVKADNVPSVRITGAVGNVGVGSTTILNALGQANDDTDGIVVGTGTTAVDITDYAMETQIAEGTGSGQLTHAAVVHATAVVTTASECRFETSRNFSNTSGAAITIRECGIYTRSGAAPFNDFCVIRDVITPLVVPDGGAVTVMYIIKIAE